MPEAAVSSIWQPVEVLAAGMVTPVGLTASATAAAVRARIARVRFTRMRNTRFEPLLGGFLDDDLLPPLTSVAGQVQPPPERYQRMLRLATRALQEAAGHDAQQLPVILALPEPRPETPFLPGTTFLGMLASQSAVPLDLHNSHTICQGRAGGLLAIESALRLLAMGRISRVLVGAVDTYRDLPLLAALDMEGRLHVKGISDGFVPGEGSAFLLLSRRGKRARHGRKPLAFITSIGVGHEEGHRYSDKPYRGDGLSQAFHELFQRRDVQSARVRSIFAGFNGESFWAKEWGVALLRHRQHFAEKLQVEHPIECIGDPGAALGPMMIALAAFGLHKGYREAPCLVWCSSDREERAAVLLEGTQQPRGP